MEFSHHYSGDLLYLITYEYFCELDNLIQVLYDYLEKLFLVCCVVCKQKVSSSCLWGLEQELVLGRVWNSVAKK